MSPICWLSRRRLDAYHDGELAPDRRARVEAHLASCRRCDGELAATRRLRLSLAGAEPDLPEPVWDAFWPQVRARLATAAVPAPLPARPWVEVKGHRRFFYGSALAAAALAILAVVAPWSGMEHHPGLLAPPSPVAVAPAITAGGSVQQVLVQSAEAEDPQSSVMVYTSPDSDVTVVWVFGLQPTDI